MSDQTLERFYDKIEIKPSGCWYWLGHREKFGYGKFWYHGKNITAHRFSYEVNKEEIKKGLELDHLCRNPSCVNPKHLEAVTPSTNSQRRNLTKIILYNKSKTHCPQGHEYNEKNTYVSSDKHRHCRVCNRIKKRIRREIEG